MTYQSEQGEGDVDDEHRAQSGKALDQKEDGSPDGQTEESEEDKRDEKVRPKPFFHFPHHLAHLAPSTRTGTARNVTR